MRRLLIALLFVLACAPAAADLSQFEFADAAEEQRFKELISELRCLVCQNQSLSDSDAGLAQDLRMETYKLMKQGMTDEQVTQFLVDRYGDFVRYRPPLNATTSLLWFGPLVVFLAAAFWVARTIRRQQAGDEPGLSDADRARLDQLLDHKDKT